MNQPNPRFLATVPRALTSLYRDGRRGYWVDPITTSYVAIALLTTRESPQSPHLLAASRYLCATFKKEEIGGSWASELSDTALAIRALRCLSREREGLIDDAFAWISSKQLPDGSFDGEPWDSLYVALAALEANQLDLIVPTLRWLVSTQAVSGALISSHYTGLFCEVLARGLEQESLPSALHQELREAALKALGFLWNGFEPGTLWSGTSWTNALVIQGMVALHHPQLLSRYDDILDWYAVEQSPIGVWEDTVRTAMVVEALWKLQLAFEIDRCYKRQLESLTIDFFIRSTEEHLVETVCQYTTKSPIISGLKFVEKDSEGNFIIALTRQRQLYLGIAAFVLSCLWGLLTNWSAIRHLFGR